MCIYTRDFAGVQWKKGYMKKINPLKLAIAVLGFATTASLVGSISGTIAWYAYSTRALISYTGTSVQSTTQLQIGIKSDVPVSFTTNTDLIEDVTFEEDLYYDEVNDPDHEHKLYHHHYYFMRVGSGGMPAAVINDYLSTKGYATNVLEPLSSYGYNTGENINLRNRPVTNKPDDAFTPAEITKYVNIPFVFRVLAANSSTLTYVSGHDVFLSGAQTAAATALEGRPENVIHNSIRLFIDRTNGSKFIFNPSSEDDGRDKVAGVLNLTGGGPGNGCFDYDNDPSSSTYMEEYIYGDYTWKEGKDRSNSLSEPLGYTSGLVDINGTGNDTVETTFTSRHHKDVKYFSDLDSCINPRYANYLGTETVFPQKNAQGDLEGNYAVCRTGNAASHYLGLFNMIIYLEGWDHTVIDSQLQNKFYLGLTFEINIVR